MAINKIYFIYNLVFYFFLIINYYTLKIVHYENLRLHNASKDYIIIGFGGLKKENIWLYTFYFILLLVFDLWIVDLMLDYLIALIYQQ